MSAGWQSNSRQMASRVEKRMPLTLPVLSRERLVTEIPMRLANSVNDIFLFASMTSSRISMDIAMSPGMGL